MKMIGLRLVRCAAADHIALQRIAQQSVAMEKRQ
jgi:hypothetical protein